MAVGTAATVTLARKFLLEASESFRDATDRSNAQILPSLAKDPVDIAWVSFAPALGEEALFRCALVPAIAPDWRGVCIAGSVFGLLHLSGGRNWTFATWASFVGCVYGAAMLLTEDGMVPVVAHALANAASAWMWIKKHEDIVNDYHEAKEDRLDQMEKLNGTSDTTDD